MDGADVRVVRNFRDFRRQLQGALQPFETAREWADLSACLVALRKVVTKAWRVSTDGTRTSLLVSLDVDLKRLLSRRLAQCLNTSFPSGVHLRTLELYDDIFSHIGTEGLVLDLAIYSSGLFPFVQHASINVKITTITLFEQHYIPLRARLQPCISGLLVALLPCIEDDKSQIYDRMCSLLLSIAQECVGERTFCCALWLTILKTPRVRLPALTCWSMVVEQGIKVPVTHLSQSSAMEAVKVESVVTLTEDTAWSLDSLPDGRIEQYLPGRGALILQALESVFKGSNNLVKRSALDTVIRFLPMKSKVFTPESKVQLVRMVIRLLYPYDWSLARRITSFLTASSSPEVDQDGILYFSEHVRSLVAWAFREDFPDGDTGTVNDTKPVNEAAFKTLICLLDELGEVIAESIMDDLVVSILSYIEKKRASPAAIAQGKELFNLETVCPSWVWRSLQQLWSKQSKSNNPGSCMQALTLNAIYMDELLDDKRTELSNLHSLLARALLSFPLIAPTPSDMPLLKDVLMFSSNLLERVRAMRALSQNPREGEDEGLCDAAHGFFAFFTETLRGLDTPDLNLDMLQAYESMAHVPTQLNQLLQLSTSNLAKEIPPWVVAIADTTQSTNPPLMCAVVRTFVQVLDSSCDDHIRAYLLGAPVCCVVEHLWCTMHVDVSADVIIVQLLLDLHDVVLKHQQPHAVSHVLESLVATSETSEQKLNSVARYATVWRNAHISDQRAQPQRREIFPGVMKQVLDCLSAADPALRHYARTWIMVAMANLQDLVDPLLSDLVAFVKTSRDERDPEKVLYIFEKLHALLETDHQLFIGQMQNTSLVESLYRSFVPNPNPDESGDSGDYIDLTIKLCEHLIVHTAEAELAHAVRAAACEFLKRFLSPLPRHRAKRVACALSDTIVQFLRDCIERNDHVMQEQLLSLLRVMMVLSHTELQAPGIRLDSRHRTLALEDVDTERPDEDECVPLAYSPNLIPILLEGLLRVNSQSQEKSLGMESSIVHYIEFVVFVLKYVPSDAMTGFFISVVSKSLDSFVQQIHFYTQNANVELFQLCTVHFLRGVQGIIHLCLGRCEDAPKQATGSFFAWSTQEPPETASSKAVRDVLLNGIPSLLEVCVDTAVVVERSKTSGGFRDGLCSTREIILKQMVSVLDSIFHRFPQVFMESVIGIWQGNITSSFPKQKLQPLLDLLMQIGSATPERVLQCTFVLLDNVTRGMTTPWRDNLLPDLPDSRIRRPPPGFRESVLFHFVHSFLSSSSAESCYQSAHLVYNLVLVTVQHSKEPLSPLWCLALLGTFDRVMGHNVSSKGFPPDPFKNSNSVKSATVKKTLHKLIAHITNLARKDVDITKHGCDLDVPLPPHVAVADQMVHDDYATHDVETLLAFSALRMLTVYFASLKSSSRTIVKDSLIEGFIQQFPHLLPMLHNHSEQTLVLRYHVLSSLCHFPFTVYPTTISVLQKPILHVIGTTDFFKADMRSLRCWRTLIEHVAVSEHSRLPGENLQSLLPVPKWGGFFSSTEQQDTSKALYLKRLSFLVFSCPKDTFASETRWCIDTIFSCLATSSDSHGVIVEVFHALRVLLFRVSEHYLASSWPIILVELIKVLSCPALLQTPTGRGCILAALKLVDISGLLNLEEFALHQWMFQATDPDKKQVDETRMASTHFRPITVSLQDDTRKEIGEGSLSDFAVRSHITTTNTMLEHLHNACAILNDNTISNLLSRQQLSDEERTEMIQIDFLEKLQTTPLDNSVLDGFKCAMNLETQYPQHVERERTHAPCRESGYSV